DLPVAPAHRAAGAYPDRHVDSRDAGGTLARVRSHGRSARDPGRPAARRARTPRRDARAAHDAAVRAADAGPGAADRLDRAAFRAARARVLAGAQDAQARFARAGAGDA